METRIENLKSEFSRLIAERDETLNNWRASGANYYRRDVALEIKAEQLSVEIYKINQEIAPYRFYMQSNKEVIIKLDK